MEDETKKRERGQKCVPEAPVAWPTIWISESSLMTHAPASEVTFCTHSWISDGDGEGNKRVGYGTLNEKQVPPPESICLSFGISTPRLPAIHCLHVLLHSLLHETSLLKCITHASFQGGCQHSPPNTVNSARMPIAQCHCVVQPPPLWSLPLVPARHNHSPSVQTQIFLQGYRYTHMHIHVDTHMCATTKIKQHNTKNTTHNTFTHKTHNTQHNTQHATQITKQKTKNIHTIE